MQDNKQTKKLFSEFDPVSTEAWMERVKADYKTDDPLSKINWKTGEGFDISGIFRQEDLKDLGYLNSLPGEFPYTRGTKTDNDWKVNGIITESDIATANQTAVKAICRGANSIEFNCKNVNSTEDLTKLFKDISIEVTQIVLVKADDFNALLGFISQYITDNKIDANKVNFVFNTDLFEFRTKNGQYKKSFDDTLVNQIKFVKDVIKLLPNSKAISIKGDLFHNSGATVVQELAYTLSSAIEHVELLNGNDLSLEKLLKTFSFRMAIGSSYFIEIAKFRALRYLFAKAIESYNADLKHEAKAYVLAQSSRWNKSIFDPYVNMLRTTTETMAASTAGVDIISVDNFDEAYQNDSVFSRRISQNQQIVIKEEAHFDKVVDIAGGSYYLENMTDTIIENVWNLFMEIEEFGGYSKYMEADKIKSEIEQSADKKLLNVATRRLNVLGTNQFPNQGEFMLEEIKKNLNDNTAGLSLRRATEEFDTLRLETEAWEKANGKRPVIQLISFGNVAMRKARAGFISNFFACAGYEVKEEENCKTIEQARELANNADLSILCSSDDEYLEFATKMNELFVANGEKPEVLIAGFFKNTDAYKAVGISDFIHVRTNVLECLKSYNNKFYQS